jgi:small-conductance mechanosensitive channel
MPFFLLSFNRFQDWLEGHGPNLVIILVLLVAADFLFRRVLSRLLRRAIEQAARGRLEDPVLVRRRADTLAATMNWVFGIFLLFVGVALVLGEVGLNVTALVAGVGVVGIAIGLGAQMLVRDVINGLFILLERQYAVGDLVRVGGVSGEVLEINPRRTVLRDSDGNVHSIPNSAISVATNMTQSLTHVTVDVQVSYEEIAKVTALVDEACREVAAERADDIIHEPRIERVTALPDGSVNLRVTGDARDAVQWAVSAELRQRIKQRLAEAGVAAEESSRHGAT